MEKNFIWTSIIIAVIIGSSFVIWGRFMDFNKIQITAGPNSTPLGWIGTITYMIMIVVVFNAKGIIYRISGWTLSRNLYPHIYQIVGIDKEINLLKRKKLKNIREILKKIGIFRDTIIGIKDMYSQFGFLELVIDSMVIDQGKLILNLKHLLTGVNNRNSTMASLIRLRMQIEVMDIIIPEKLKKGEFFVAIVMSNQERLKHQVINGPIKATIIKKPAYHE